MDDARTQRTLDHLADLYLSSRQDDTPATPASTDNARQNDASPPLPSAGPGVRPMRLPPKLRVSHASEPGRHAAPLGRTPHAEAGPARPWAQVRAERRAQQASLHTQDDMQDDALDDQSAADVYAFPTQQSRSFDAAATGVMTDAAGDITPTGSAGEIEPVQAVFLGNLPGFAGPWLAQYAQLLARPQQRVAIIHVQGQQLQVELVSPPNQRPAAIHPQPTSLIDLFEQLVADDACPLTRWLVHLPLPASALQLEMARDFDCWTLLTGRDDTALAAGEKWLAAMLADDRRARFRRIGAAVMGCEPDAGQAVIEHLSRIAGDQVATNFVQRPGRKQMAPVNVHQLGVFTPTSELWTELVAYLASFEPARPSADEPLAHAHTGTAGPESSHATSAMASHPSDGAFQLPPSRRVPKPSQTQEQMREQPQEQPMEQPLEQFAAVDEPSSRSVQSPVLATLVDPQMALLEARCPYQPTIELAIDAAGVIHLFAQAGPSLSETAMALQEASQWAAAHQSLLQLTCPDSPMDASASPVAHLLTGQSIAAAAMSQRLGMSLKLHVLLQATQSQPPIWVTAPLN